MSIDPKIEAALRAVTEWSDAQPKFGALIVRDAQILAQGHAHRVATDPALAEYPLLLAHAEESALLAALRDRTDVSGADIYVLGVRATGETRYSPASYCCVVCSRLLAFSGIARVVFPVEGGWEAVSVAEMFARAEQRLREEKG